MNRRSIVPVVLVTLVAAGCSSLRAAVGLSYSYPSFLARTWVDSSLATPTDTVAWVLGSRGLDQTLTIHVGPDSAGRTTRSEHLDGYGYWYVKGEEAQHDTGHICFRSRARGRDACYAYEVAEAPRPRLLIVAYQGRRHTRDRVLVAR
jgi:hypothetical protein